MSTNIQKRHSLRIKKATSNDTGGRGGGRGMGGCWGIGGMGWDIGGSLGCTGVGKQIQFFTKLQSILHESDTVIYRIHKYRKNIYNIYIYVFPERRLLGFA